VGGVRQRISLFVCRRRTVCFDKMQLFGLPDAVEDMKNKKKRLKLNYFLFLYIYMRCWLISLRLLVRLNE